MAQVEIGGFSSTSGEGKTDTQKKSQGSQKLMIMCTNAEMLKIGMGEERYSTKGC